MNTTLTAELVHDHADMLCEALKHDYIENSIKRQCFFGRSDPDGLYYKKRIQELKDGVNCYDFIVEKGRKYLKVIMVTEDGAKSAHAFVIVTLVMCTWQQVGKHLHATVLGTT